MSTAKKTTPTTFSQEHIQQMFAVCDLTTASGQRDYTMMSMLLETGARASELCRLRLQDIHENRIHVQNQKSRKMRCVELAPAVNEQLRYYIIYHRGPFPYDGSPVFVDNDGHSFTSADLSQFFRAIKKRAGITDPNISLHTFRHTYALRMFRCPKQP